MVCAVSAASVKDHGITSDDQRVNNTARVFIRLARSLLRRLINVTVAGDDQPSRSGGHWRTARLLCGRRGGRGVGNGGWLLCACRSDARLIFGSPEPVRWLGSG